MNTVVNRGVQVHVGQHNERVLLMGDHLKSGHVALFMNGLNQLDGPINGYGRTEMDALRDLSEKMDELEHPNGANWAAGVRVAAGDLGRPVTQMTRAGQDAILSIRRRNGTLPARDYNLTVVEKVTGFLRSLVA